MRTARTPSIGYAAATSLALLFSAHCNVYNASLLGTEASGIGGRVPTGQSGTAGTIGGASGGADDGESAGEPSVEQGGAGFGGLAEVGGAIETGGAMTAGGSGGNPQNAAGQGGAAGGGAGGSSAGAGGTSGAGAGGTGGVGGALQTANGCAKLVVPLASASDKAHFVISLTSPVDMSGATLSMRVYVQAGTGGWIFNYVQDNNTYRFLGVPTAKRRQLNSLSGWSTIDWDVGAEPDSAATGIAKTSIKNIGIEINAQPASSWSNPTVVFIDSIVLATPSRTFAFDATSSVYTTPTSTNAPGQALWLNAGATDTTATGAALSWQATCP